MSTEPKAAPGGQILLMRVLGAGATFGGAALVMHILIGISLGLALAVAGAVLLASAGLIWRTAALEVRGRIARRAREGLLGGLGALVAYDASKWLLSQFDASPYNPFEAIPVFGRLLLGENRPALAIVAAGSGFHALNGVSFGIAFAFLFGARGVVAGIAWGLFLETFQLALYPGWLGSTFLAEFVQISALSHVVYGATLGLLCKTLRREPATARPEIEPERRSP